MRPFFYKFLQLLSVIIAVIILAVLLSGQVYVRQPPAGVVKNGNFSGNVTESWPWKITLGLSSFVGAIPNPNFDAAETDLVSAWHLPPYSRLSPIMRQMARCELAARARPFQDTTRCRRVKFWPIIVFVSVTFVAVFNLYRFVFGFPSDHATVKNRYLISCVPFLAGWFVALAVIWVHDVYDGLGLTYTPYGEMFPKPYYPMSGDWFLVVIMVQVGYYVSAVECFAYAYEDFSTTERGKKIKAWFFKSDPIKVKSMSSRYV